jgi:cell division initiation protein
VKLTPLEVDQQQFQRVFRGCDPDEVHRFLDLVSREMEEMIRENTQFKEELRRRDAQIAEFRTHEAQLREALVSAGRITDEMKETARKEAELVVAEAQLRAQRLLHEAQERSVQLMSDVHDLKRQKTRLVAEVRAILESHRRLLEAHDELDRLPEARGAAPSPEATSESRAPGRSSESTRARGERAGRARSGGDA